MNATKTKVAPDQAYHYQVSFHGCGRYSVQCFGPDDSTRDETLIKDVDGYRTLGEGVQHRTPEEAAANVFADFAGLTITAGQWATIEQEFRYRG